MSTVDKLMDISSRLEQLENNAEWIAKETVQTDSSVSQTSTLIMALADDIRERVCALVSELENVKTELLEDEETIH